MNFREARGYMGRVVSRNGKGRNDVIILHF